MGFAETMRSIVSNLPSERQTMLFSATQTRYSSFSVHRSDVLIIHWNRSIRELALVSLKKPVYVSVHEKADSSTPSNLTQVHLDILEMSNSITDVHRRVTSFVKYHRRSVLSGHSSKIISNRRSSSSSKAANRYRSDSLIFSIDRKHLLSR